VRDIPDERIGAVGAAGRLTASSNFQDLSAADAILISVPTPLTKGAPDLSMVVGAGKAVAQVVKPGTLVVLESTTYPGTTEELLIPLLEAEGLVPDEDLLIAYSPERIDPGNPNYAFGDIPKVVGGLNKESTEAAAALYQVVVPKIVSVSGTREAEMTKLMENTFRHVNIALVNELAVYAHEMGIDIWEVIGAAATKPFGFLPFWPGPGWGGHCIPLDPAYLSYKVRQGRAHEVRFVELAHAVNSEMPRYVVERIFLMLNEAGKTVKGSAILGVGVGYKGGTEDTRESAGLKVLSTLQQRGAHTEFHDPLVPSADFGGQGHASQPLTPELLRSQDLVVVLAPQTGVDWELIEREALMVLDCCNAFGKRNDKIVRL
jgi:nucleotide sugar dehydrogenase